MSSNNQQLQQLLNRILFGGASVLLAVMGFIGMRLMAEVDANTESNHQQAVVDAAMVEQIKNLDQTLFGLKKAIEGLIEHEVEHRQEGH